MITLQLSFLQEKQTIASAYLLSSQAANKLTLFVYNIAFLEVLWQYSLITT